VSATLRLVRRRVVGITMLATALLVAVPAPARAGLVGVASSTATPEYCGRLVALQDTVAGVRAAVTGPAVFAAIRRAAKEFRKVAADAPGKIADDMALLAKSFSDLDRALRPLASKIRAAKSQADYDGQAERVSAVFERWSNAHDQQAIADAQAAVDEWTQASCGFRLSSGTGSSDDTAATTTTNPSVTSGR
jgi:hypothetical protein